MNKVILPCSYELHHDKITLLFFQVQFHTSTIFISFRIWSRFDYRHTGLLDYEDFLVKLGVKQRKAGTRTPDINTGTDDKF